MPTFQVTRQDEETPLLKPTPRTPKTMATIKGVTCDWDIKAGFPLAASSLNPYSAMRPVVKTFTPKLNPPPKLTGVRNICGTNSIFTRIYAF